MTASATTISSWALLIARALEQYGLESRAVFHQVGLDPDKLNDTNARYPVHLMQDLWRLCVELTGLESFGLSAAKHWHPTTFHALGYAWLASGTLREAMERAQRYSRIVSDVATFDVAKAGGAYRFSLLYPKSDTPIAPASVDAAVGTLLIMVREAYGDEVNPVMVAMPRVQPRSQSEYNEFFQSPIEFESNECSLSFMDDIVDKPLPTANAELAHANDKIIKDYIAHLDRECLAARIKAALLDYLSAGSVTESDMAAAVNMSLRSFQRKLREEGTSFKELLEETRQELADQYLKNSRLSLGEITFLLGFSEPSNFTRAFKRWKGVSPSEYRTGL
jgi:AraC-like DNA-binding protein